MKGLSHCSGGFRLPGLPPQVAQAGQWKKRVRGKPAHDSDNDAFRRRSEASSFAVHRRVRGETLANGLLHHVGRDTNQKRRFQPEQVRVGSMKAYASGSGCTLVNAKAMPNFPSVSCSSILTTLASHHIRELRAFVISGGRSRISATSDPIARNRSQYVNAPFNEIFAETALT